MLSELSEAEKSYELLDVVADAARERWLTEEPENKEQGRGTDAGEACKIPFAVAL